LAEIGYTMMCEQRSPKDLVNDLIHAERAGFDFSVISDHFHPCLEEQGHSGYAWSILGPPKRPSGKPKRLCTLLTKGRRIV
jgi:hypothetical protein